MIFIEPANYPVTCKMIRVISKQRKSLLWYRNSLIALAIGIFIVLI
jgi:hypothetical protein